MKLPRAVAAAAATAVVTPLAVLSASVAFAGAPGTAGATASTSPSAGVTPTGTTASPTATAPTGSATTPTTPTASTTPTTPAATGSGEPDPGEGPEEPDRPFCEDVDVQHDAKVSADIKGLPGKIVAGDGPHTFRLVLTNDSDAAIEDIRFYAEVENHELEESRFLSPYVELEFKDGSGWTRIGDGDWAGDEFLDTTLAANASTSVELRLTVDAGAPAGDAYSFGSGAYLDRVDGEDCIAEGWAQYDFEVLKAGSAAPSPGTATPSDSDKKPQGGAGADTSGSPGNLAATGSSSALPVIALVGGFAVVAGAGAVFAVRRRRTGADE
ncbi:LAETG motif-containing sortase-dependent surface protein [Streptomyces sp. NPDC093094]|uniref:LAETG motif-containing sortase-dependent surface protein n=1 Tax=Streptomyces sp. NPDC093094 TaxID=3366026 RepID=UPI003819408B